MGSIFDEHSSISVPEFMQKAVQMGEKLFNCTAVLITQVSGNISVTWAINDIYTMRIVGYAVLYCFFRIGPKRNSPG